MSLRKYAFSCYNIEEIFGDDVVYIISANLRDAGNFILGGNGCKNNGVAVEEIIGGVSIVSNSLKFTERYSENSGESLYFDDIWYHVEPMMGISILHCHISQLHSLISISLIMFQVV